MLILIKKNLGGGFLSIFNIISNKWNIFEKVISRVDSLILYWTACDESCFADRLDFCLLLCLRLSQIEREMRNFILPN